MASEPPPGGVDFREVDRLMWSLRFLAEATLCKSGMDRGTIAGLLIGGAAAEAKLAGLDLDEVIACVREAWGEAPDGQ